MQPRVVIHSDVTQLAKHTTGTKQQKAADPIFRDDRSAPQTALRNHMRLCQRETQISSVMVSATEIALADSDFFYAE